MNRSQSSSLRLPRWLLGSLLAGLCCAPTSHAAAPLGSGVDEGAYLIVLADEPAEVAASALALAEAFGGTVDEVYEHALRGFLVRGLGPEAAARLAKDPRVRSIEPNRVLHLGPSPSRQALSSPPRPSLPADLGVADLGAGSQPAAPWHLDRLDRVTPTDGRYDYTHTGAGVHVYMIGSGVRDTHVELQGRASRDYDAVGDGQNGRDCHGSGTAAAGVLGAASWGAAKQVRIHSVRVVDCEGRVTTADMVEGLDWVVAHAERPAILLLTTSTPASNAVDDAAWRAITSGMVVIAGQFRPGFSVAGLEACLASPARLLPVLSVGGVDSFRRRDRSINDDMCLELFAPGSEISTTTAENDTARTATASGSHLAAALTAGVAALVWEEHPHLEQGQVRQEVLTRAIAGHVRNLDPGQPNLFLQSLALLPAPAQLSITNGGCYGLNDAVWSTVPGATRYELYASAYPNFVSETLIYQGPNYYFTFDVPATRYLRVRACASRCGPFRSGDQPAFYVGSCD